MRDFHFWHRWFILIIAPPMLLLSLAVFPRASTVNWNSLGLDLVFFCATLVALFVIARWQFNVLLLGLNVFALGRWFEILNELVSVPSPWKVGVPVALQLVGLGIVIAGLVLLDRYRQDELARARQTADELRRWQAEFYDLYENATDAIFTFDSSGVFLSANKTALQLVGYTRDQISCLNIADVLAPEDVPLMSERLVRAITTQSDLADEQPWQCTVVRQDGTRFPAEVRTRLLWRDNRIIGLQGSARDVTELQRTYEVLRHREAILQAVSFAAAQFLKTMEWRQSIAEVLAHLGQATEVSRVYIFENVRMADGALVCRQTFEWCAPGVTSQIANPAFQAVDLVAAGYARWQELLSNNLPIVGNVRDFPASEQPLLREQDILSLVCVPIFVSGEWWGFMGFDDCRCEREWASTEIEALRTAADIFGAAIARERVDTTLADQTRHLALLNQVTHMAMSASTLDVLMPSLAERLSELFRAEGCQIVLWDEVTQRMLGGVAYGLGKTHADAVQLTPAEQTWAQTVLRAGHVVTVDDVTSTSLLNPQTVPAGVGAMLGLPLMAGDKKMGVVLILFAQPHHFTPDEIARSEQTATQLSLAFANLQSNEQARARLARVSALHEIEVAFASTLSLMECLDLLLMHTRVQLNCDIASVFLIDATQTMLHVVAQHGARYLSAAGHVSFAVGTGAAGWVVAQGKTLALPNVNDDPRWLDIEESRKEGIVSYLGVPLMVGTRVIGVLDIATRTRREFSAEEIDFMTTLASQAAVAIENARLFEESQRRAREQTIINDITRALTTTLDVRNAFPAIAEGVRALIPCDRVSLALLNEARTQFTVFALDKPRPELGEGTTFPLTATAATEDVLAGRVHVTDDLAHEAHKPVEKILYEAGYRARINLPLSVGDQVIGSLNLVSRHLGDLAPLTSLQQIANAIAIAIQNMRLFEAEQARRAELTSLYTLSRELADLNEMDAIMQVVIQRAVETMHVTFARLALCENKTFIVRAAYPIRATGHDLQIGRRESLAQLPHLDRLLTRGTAVLLASDAPDLSAYEREVLLLDWARVVCVAPLRVGTQVIGCLMFGEVRRHEREPFDADKLRLARGFGDQAASALHRADLFAQIQAAFLQTALALARAMDAKDTYTANHAERLAQMSLAIGRALHLSLRELEDLRYGAMLHDVGKIGVPDAVLQKPARLNHDEWQKMRRHPVIGEQILAPVPRLAGAARIVRHHHERYDGTGYPDGLAGEAIPLGARILAVVDAYSAIIDQRVYKHMQSHEYALAELERNAGTQFDPQIVQVFLQLFGRGI